MRLEWLVAALVSVGMAGCVTPDDAPEADPAGEGPPVDAIFPPLWEVGDHWTYSWPDGRSPTFVVTEDLGDAWQMDVDDAGLRFEHQTSDEYSTIGRISKANLDGYEGDSPVRFFDFPLIHGKQWRLDWDGQQFDAVAAVDGSRATIDYYQDASLARRLVYDGDIGWIRSFTGFDDAGQPAWSMDLQRSGSNFGGEYVRWDIHGRIDVDLGVGESSGHTFMVGPETDELWLRVVATCSPDGVEGDQGVYGIQLRRTDQGTGPYEEIVACPQALDDVLVAPAEEGEWILNGVSAGSRIEASVVLRTLVELTLE